MRFAALLLVAMIALPFAQPAQATEDPEVEPEQGILMQVWNGFSDLDYQPWITPPEAEPCFSGVVPNIDYDWGSGSPAEGCDADYFFLNYSGYLTVPETGAWEFLAQADDGWYMTINEQVVNNNWVPKGCGGWWSGPNEGYIQLTAGASYPLSAWMYEWGGGACTQLIYGSPTTWGVVPTEWLTTMPAAAPTPTPTQTPEPPAPSPSVAPTPTPEPSVTPPPTPEPTPEPSQEPTPEPTAEPTPSPEVTDEPEPTPDPEPSPTPEPSPEPTEEPEESPDPSPDPSPVPTPEPESPLPDVGEAVEAAAVFVGETVEAVAEAVSETIGVATEFAADFADNLAGITTMGDDLDEEERAAAQPVATAIVVSQIASSAAVAAVRSMGGTPPSSGGGGGSGGMDSPKGRRTARNVAKNRS